MVTKLINAINNLLEDTKKKKREYQKEKLIGYYDTINQGKVSIPSFILADMAIKDYERRQKNA